MRVGDIVKVADWSWCMFYGGDGDLRHIASRAFWDRRWRVLALNLDGPAYTDCCPPCCPPDGPNDLMLCELDHPENVLFTQMKHCVPVGASQYPAPVRVTVPTGTKELVVTFE